MTREQDIVRSLAEREVEQVREILEDAHVKFSQAWDTFVAANDKIIRDMGKVGELTDGTDGLFNRYFFIDDHDNDFNAKTMLGQLDDYVNGGEIPDWLGQL